MNPLREKIIRNFTDCAVIENFRLGANGELNKREGYITLGSFDWDIRGVVSDEECIYAVSGKYFYQIKNGTISKKGELDEAVFSNSKEKVTMFISSNFVFIIGGNGYYRYDITADTFAPVSGYAPIIGTTDDSENAEIIKEPFNILTRTVRRRFRLLSGAMTYSLPEKAAQVNWVKLDGEILTPSQYSIFVISEDTQIHIDSRNFPDRQILEVEYVVKEAVHAENKTPITSCKKSFVFSTDGVSVLFLYDSPYLSPGRIIYSRPASSPIDSCGVLDYFTHGREIIIGDGTKPIRAIAQLGDRIIVITSDGIYSLSASVLSSGDIKFYVSRLRTEFGASENSGCAVLDNNLYFVNESGLFRLFYESVSGTFNTVQIDIPECAIQSRSEYKNIRLHIDRRNSELWCYTENGIGVYSIRYRTWYRFNGITADFFFTSSSQTAFVSENRLNLFDENTYTDGTEGFDAFVESKNLSFDNVFTEKTIYGFGAAFERHDNAVLECVLFNDKGNDFRAVIESDDSGLTSPVVLHTHARLGKSAYIIYRLISPAYAAPANVREIMFRYRTTGG